MNTEHTPIQTLNLSVRAENCLLAEGLKTVEDLSFYFRENGVIGLLKIPNLGRKWAHEVADRVNAWLVNAPDKGSQEAKPLMASDATLRDHFADKALPLAMEDYRLCIGFTAKDIDWETRGGLSVVASRAYQLADAMLRARGEA